MKSNKKLKQAKSAANTERNRRKAQARFTKANAPRRQRDGFIGFIQGAPLVPVLDLLNLGGPGRVRAVSCIRHQDSGGKQARAAMFHNKVADAFAAAEGKA